MSKKPLLKVEHLNTVFTLRDHLVSAVRDVNFNVFPSEIIGVVGESGSGKTQIFLSILGLLAKNGETTGVVEFEGKNLLALNQKALNQIRGDKISIIFQDPLTALNPYLKISTQMIETLQFHKGLSKEESLRRAIEMLDLVQIPGAKRRIHLYPHEFSGGMRQRVLIAMALLCKPKILIADEPTTALDVTISTEILQLLKDINKELKTSIIMITHDLGVVAGLCHRVMVMYAGEIIETAPIDAIFKIPQHPYTKALLAASPRVDEKTHDYLKNIPGSPPSLLDFREDSCPFAPRCDYVFDKCWKLPPKLLPVAPDHLKACFYDMSKEYDKTHLAS